MIKGIATYDIISIKVLNPLANSPKLLFLRIPEVIAKIKPKINVKNKANNFKLDLNTMTFIDSK